MIKKALKEFSETLLRRRIKRLINMGYSNAEISFMLDTDSKIVEKVREKENPKLSEDTIDSINLVNQLAKTGAVASLNELRDALNNVK